MQKWYQGVETMEPIEPPWQAIKEWIPDEDPDLNWFNQERNPTGSEPESYDQPVLRSLGEGVSSTWQPKEIPLGRLRLMRKKCGAVCDHTRLYLV